MRHTVVMPRTTFQCFTLRVSLSAVLTANSCQIASARTLELGLTFQTVMMLGMTGRRDREHMKEQMETGMKAGMTTSMVGEWDRD